MLGPVVRVLLPLVQVYSMGNVSSGSVTEAEHVRLLSLYAALVGLMVKLLSTGGVFSMMAVAVPNAPVVIPSVGVTCTDHSCPWLVAEEGSVSVVYAPCTVPPKNHS